MPVDVPVMTVVHTARLEIQQDAAKTQPASWVMALGQVLQARLIIEHTRQSSEGGEESESLGFWYDIDANLDNWLVGGQRSARFSAKVGNLSNSGMGY